ncbi:Protein NRT1/ PTR FAMILY 5.8 [Camellia lanceoleosa]|nr:Protein NRT1/ PTR FAMILY 5.8 [Camellia lanceoleosa]
MTNVWKLKFTHATAIINVFWGLMGIILIPKKFIVDVFMGNYWVLVISSFAYSALRFGILNNVNTSSPRQGHSHLQSVGPTMRAYGVHFGLVVTMGLGSLGSVLLVYLLGKASERGGKQSWFQDTLNHSQLDKYYWTLAWLSVLNLGLYIVVALYHRFKTSELEDEDATNYDSIIGLF